MRASFLVIVAAALFGAASALSACGGSASETPFPIEPDRATLAGADGGARSKVTYAGEAEPEGDDTATDDLGSESLEPEGAAESTWGAKKKR